MQNITTVTTSVPVGDDEGGQRIRQLVARDEDLAAHGRAGYRLHNTQVITGTERVTFVDTLTRESE
jgi:hypothetical protein